LLFYAISAALMLSFYFLVHCSNFRFSKWRPSAILDFHIFAIFSKIQISVYFNVDLQNLVKIGRSAANYCVFSIFNMAAVRHLEFVITS